MTHAGMKRSRHTRPAQGRTSRASLPMSRRRLSKDERDDARLSKLLLHLARGIFEEQTNLEKLVQKIMLDAQDLLKCEKCCVYLLEDTCERDISRFTQAFLSRLGTYSRNPLVLSLQGICLTIRALEKQQGGTTTTQKKITAQVPETAKPKLPEEVVFCKAFDLNAKNGTVTVPSAQVLAVSKTAHIAKFVVTTGEPVNVADADTDGRFGMGPCVDTSGNRIKNVLCMPIHNSEKNIIGVTQLINKVNGQPFNENDVNIIEAFSIFTGLGIHNCQMYENACQLMAKQSVALEVLSFHATAHTEETNALQNTAIPTAVEMCLYNFDFDDHLLDDDGTLKACMRMFLEADLINTFKIPYDVACRWLCTVKKNYRPVTYHNWRHAFNVCQTMFAILFTGELCPLFEDLEVFTLLAACLCHDLDHRGTNNAFQTKVASPLAMLYSTSVLEHHHFDHCIMILNSEGNNIFQSLSPDEYRRAIKLVEHAILSTDLALYFKKRGDFKKLVESGEKTFSDKPKRDLLRAMMMTACDVAAITKPWKIQQEVAQLVMAEFFEQGDIERYQLGEQPIPMMDRNKKDELPKMQVGFIDAICMPVYKLFAVITEKLVPLYSGCDSNRRRWQEKADQHQAQLLALTEAELQEGEPLHTKALPGPDESQQGLQSQQAVHTADLSPSSSQHQQTQTDDPQNGALLRQRQQQQQQDHPLRHPPRALGSSAHAPAGRQPQESQLGGAGDTSTTTSTTTSPPSSSSTSSSSASASASASASSSSSSCPSPHDVSKAPQRPCQSTASSAPPLSNGKASQTDGPASATSPPSLHHSRSNNASQPDSGDPSSADPRPDRPAHALPDNPVSHDLSSAPSMPSPPAFTPLPKDSESPGGPCQTVFRTAIDCCQMGPGQDTLAKPPHPQLNGHATAAKKTGGSEVWSEQTDSSATRQSPSLGTSPGKKLKAQGEAHSHASSSRHGHKSGLCLLS